MIGREGRGEGKRTELEIVHKSLVEVQAFVNRTLKNVELKTAAESPEYGQLE